MNQLVIAAKIGNHTFRATGITAFLKNGGTLEKPAAMANHASTRTTQFYDRRRDDMGFDEVERIVIRIDLEESTNLYPITTSIR
jgi:integrase